MFYILTTIISIVASLEVMMLQTMIVKDDRYLMALDTPKCFGPFEIPPDAKHSYQLVRAVYNLVVGTGLYPPLGFLLILGSYVRDRVFMLRKKSGNTAAAITNKMVE